MDSTLHAKLTSIFATQLNIEVPSTDTDLLGAGLLDSLALVDLLVNIEQEFGLVISLDTLEIDSFRSIDSIAEFIQSQQASKEMAA